MLSGRWNQGIRRLGDHADAGASGKVSQNHCLVSRCNLTPCRPQYDDSAVAVIITKQEKAKKYEKIFSLRTIGSRHVEIEIDDM